MSNFTPTGAGETADDASGATTGGESSADLDKKPTDDAGDVKPEAD